MTINKKKVSSSLSNNIKLKYQLIVVVVLISHVLETEYLVMQLWLLPYAFFLAKWISVKWNSLKWIFYLNPYKIGSFFGNWYSVIWEGTAGTYKAMTNTSEYVSLILFPLINRSKIRELKIINLRLSFC